MSIEYIRFSINRQDQINFIKSINQACIILDSYIDCISYEVSHCEEDDLLFIWRIVWTSTRSHVEGFRKDPIFDDFFKLMEPFLSKIEEMNHYNKIV